MIFENLENRLKVDDGDCFSVIKCRIWPFV